MIESDDIILESLLEAGKEFAARLPEDLLRKAYEIQVNHQFEKDRNIPLRALQNLVEDYLNSLAKKEEAP